MKYVAIDIETTGLEPDRNDIIEFGAVIEDSNDPKPFDELPQFQTYVHDGQPLFGDVYALNMNVDIIRILAEKPADSVICSPDDLFDYFLGWLNAHGLGIQDRVTLKFNKINVAGKNFAAFDMRFLRRNDERWGKLFHHRFLDPATGNISWKIDETAPNLDLCLQRQFGDGPSKLHSALFDCWDVIRLLRRQY